MKLAQAACLVLFALLSGACGLRENGESCWSDEQCVSGHCSWGGTCSPGLLELIAEWLQDDPEPPPPLRPPPPPPTYLPTVRSFRLCVNANEKECRATPQCSWTALCLIDFSSPIPDAGVLACAREHNETGICPSGCRRSGLCSSSSL